LRRIFARGDGDDAIVARRDMGNETRRELEDKLAYYLAQASYAAEQASRLADDAAAQEQFRMISETWTALAEDLRLRLTPMT
jgi:hypothetical protein